MSSFVCVCHLSQGCNKVLWGLLGTAVVITLTLMQHLTCILSESDTKRPFTLDDYFNDTIRWRSYNLYWISDKEYLHKTAEGNVFLYNAETNETSLYLSNSTFGQVDATHYLLSGDNKYVAFESNFTKFDRDIRTIGSDYDSFIFLWPRRTFVMPANLPTVVQYFGWAPTGHKYAYVSDYNIFLKSDVTAEAVQLTHNGKKNEILNGIPDWVYEEEVFASNGAIWWSTTGKYLAYLEVNDTEVNKVEFSWYGSDQYPQTVAVPYPKAGSKLTKVKLFVVDVTNSYRRTQVLPDHIMCSVTWVTDERVAVQWLTRTQNHMIVQIYDFDGSSWREKQVSLDGNAVPITSGKWEVIYISKLTQDAIYFVSNEYEGTPGKRNFYKVMTGSSPSAPQCLTCDVNKERCQYNSAYLSFDASYYRKDCFGKLPHTPTPPHPQLSVLEDNKELEKILSEFQMPKMHYGTLKIAGFDLWYQMMLPPNFKKSKKYPLLIDVYGGPCSQRVDYRFKLNWGTHLSSSHGIIFASFDGRGSGYQGDQIMHAIYRRLGTFEVEDQITAVRKFIEMGFIDKDRIAIWGWSYGGYVTSMALGAGTGLFKCGVAIAPVAKWEYYDAVYTERYMGKPTENSDAYINSTVTARAKNFKSVEYLLIHALYTQTAYNVHFQQAAQISKALVDMQVDFETMWYTDKDHGLSGSALHHTYNHMSLFLQKCLLSPK
uniref:Dipeptidyl peptidase 4-like n=1 Tax=Echeneis naucrates TaxID=173247 RepID=A0A665UG95_ECHNA